MLHFQTAFSRARSHSCLYSVCSHSLIVPLFPPVLVPACLDAPVCPPKPPGMKLVSPLPTEQSLQDQPKKPVRSPILQFQVHMKSPFWNTVCSTGSQQSIRLERKLDAFRTVTATLRAGTSWADCS